MPSIITRGAASAKGFGAFTSIGSKYWLGAFGSTSNSYNNGAAMDASGNLYTVGSSYGATYSNYDLQICKFGVSGALIWQKILTKASGDMDVGYGISTDGSYLYICGGSDKAAGPYEAFLVAVYDISGTLIWERALYGPSYIVGQDAANDSSGNLYATGYVFGPSGSTLFDIVTTKYNSTGTLQWQRQLATANNDSQFGYNVTVDSGSNVIIGGFGGVAGVLTGGLIAKYNSSGVLQWQRSIYQPGSSYYLTYIQSIVTDSSNNIYATGYWYEQQSVPPYNPIKYYRIVVKYDSSGTLLWQRQLSSSGNEQGYGIALDSSNNVYTIGGGNSGQTTIVKYNSSGTLQWQRYLSTYAGSAWPAISWANNSFGFTTGLGPTLCGRLPDDGSKTGTYTVGGTSYTYGTSSLTDAAGGLTSVASSFTDSAFSYTSVDPGLGSSTSAYTYAATTVT